MTMTFAELWAALSPTEKDALAERASTSKAYLSQIANGHRNAGWRTIQSLIAADNRVTLDMFRSRAA